jgi:hypothetical protein
MSAKPTLVQLILNATAAGKSMLTAANAAAQKVLLSLGNVDNTSDANKPVSTAQATADALRVPYTGASSDVTLGSYRLTAGKLTIAGSERIDQFGNIVTLFCRMDDTSVRANVLYIGTGLDTGATRLSAGHVEINNGTSGSQRDLSLRNLTASGLMCCGVYTFATVPSASSNTGKFLRISDRSQKHAYSDGTNWRFFGDDAVIS